MKVRKVEPDETVQSGYMTSEQWTDVAGVAEPVGGLKLVPKSFVGMKAIDAMMRIGTSCMWRMDENDQTENETEPTPRQEAIKALACLYVEMPEAYPSRVDRRTVADDVKSKVMAALDGEASREREAICAFLSSPDIFNISPALIKRIRRGDHHPGPDLTREKIDQVTGQHCPACAGTIGDPTMARVIEWCEKHASLSDDEKAKLCKWGTPTSESPGKLTLDRLEEAYRAANTDAHNAQCAYEAARERAGDIENAIEAMGG